MSTFMEIQGRKQREMMAEATKRNEQLTLAAEQAAAPPSETAAPSVDEAANTQHTDDVAGSMSTHADSDTESNLKL